MKSSFSSKKECDGSGWIFTPDSLGVIKQNKTKCLGCSNCASIRKEENEEIPPKKNRDKPYFVR